MQQALLINIWQLSAICLLTSSPLKLFQVGWGQMHILGFLQKYLIGFKSRLWLGQTFTALCISQSCCMLRVTVLLEGKPSAQSVVLNVSIFLVHWAFLLFWWVPQSLLLKNSPIAWGCYQHTLLLGWYSAGDEQSWFPSNMMLRIEVYQTRESCFLESEGPLGAFFVNSKCVFFCLHWGEDWVWPHCHKA